MATLTSCLKKAGDALRPEDRAAILAAYNDATAKGTKPAEAARAAVDAQIAEVTKLLEGMGEKVEAAVEDAPATIQDVGEKIGGARKDRWKERGLDVSDLDAMSESEGATLATKANVWKPDYDAIAETSEPVTAAMVKVVYDQLAAQPKKDTPEGRRDYVKAMQAVRKVYSAVTTPDQAKNAYHTLREELGVEVRQGSGFKTPDNADAKRVLFALYKGRSDPFVFGYNELARARKLVQEGFPGAVEPWTRRYSVRAFGGAGTTPQGLTIYVDRSTEAGTPLTREQIAAGAFEVRTKVGKTVAYAATKEDAEAAAKAIYERTKGSADSKVEPDRPHLDKVARENLPQRIDREVTPELLLQEFGFRGVEFGNWAAQDERRKVLALAYDALADLATILNVPNRALSLNGTMGLAFGARGGGKFAAHYEPGKLVINMTKLRGAGSLAHEWGHALDHYLGELDRADAYKGKARGASGWYSQDSYSGQPRARTMQAADGKWVTAKEMRLPNLRPELAEQVDAVMKRLYETAIPQEEALSIARKTVADYKAMAAREQDPRMKTMYADGADKAQQIVADLEAGKPSDRTKRSSFASEAQKLSGKSSDGYWVRPTEMLARAFESYVFDRIKAMGAKSEYLVHGVEQDRYSDGTRYKGNPYPTGAERAAINDEFAKLFDTLKTKTDDAGNVALFSRSRAPTGVPLPDAKALVAAIREALPTAPPIQIHDSVKKAPESLRRKIREAGADADVEAAYHDGEIHVFPGNIASIERMQFVVAHHEVRHHGLRSMMGPSLGPAMLRMYATNPALKAAADKKMADGLANTRILAVEEALADLSVEDMQKVTGWERIVSAVRQWLRQAAANLRRAGLTMAADAIDPTGWTDADIASLVQKAEDVSRGQAAPFRTGGTVFQRVWHGSPYRFDKFDTSAIGTGEGAQAYGYGLYFASKKEIADHYRTQLSASLRGWNYAKEAADRGISDYEGMRAAFHAHANGDAPTALAARRIQNASVTARSIDNEKLADLVRAFRRDKEGQLYAVNIPEDSEMLLWDKPLSEQPEKVRKALEAAAESLYWDAVARYARMTRAEFDALPQAQQDAAMDKFEDAATKGGLGAPKYPPVTRAGISGEDFYRELTQFQKGTPLNKPDGIGIVQYNREADKRASDALLAAGIRGIKYLDGNSRPGNVMDSRAMKLLEKHDNDVDAALAEFMRSVYNTPKVKADIEAETRKTMERLKDAAYNYVIFDGNDAQIEETVFSRAPADILREKVPQAFDVADKGGNVLAHYRSLGLQALGRRQLVDLYSDMLPALRPYSDMVQQMDADKNEAGAEADAVATEWGKLKDEGALADIMHDATLAQIDPSKPHDPEDDIADWRRLRAKYTALSPEAQAVYGKARDTYASHYAKVKAEISARIERSELSPTAKARALTRMEEEFFKQIKGVYFPLARFGSYLTVVKDGNGKTVSVSRSETINEANATRAILVRQFPADQGFKIGKVLKDREFNAARDGAGRGFMSELFATLEDKGADAEMKDAISQLYLASLPDLSWAKHGMHRKGTPGFSQDARRAFAQNVFHGARYLAKLKYADQLQAQIEKMQVQVDAKASDDGFDSVKGQQVVDEMVKRHETLMNPKSNPLSTALTSLGFVFHLGLSPASAMVNLSQTALVAYPIMGAKWGFDKAGAALAKAGAQATRHKNDISAALSGDELDAYNEAVRRGVIDVTQAHDLAGIAQGEDAKVTWALRPVMKWASFLFHHAERFNRQVTFMAAYRLAKDAGSATAMEDAIKATYDGHFDYGATNRPRIMQGNVAKVVLLFKQFGQNMVYTISRQAYLARKGETPEQRRESAKALGGLLAMHAAAAGALGLPMVTTLLAAASMLGSTDDEPWDAETALRNMLADAVGPKASEVITRGVSRLTPWDISGRVGLDRLILPDVREGLEGVRLAESFATAALGPVAGIGVNMLKGLQSISEGKIATGLEEMAPSAIRGPLRSIRFGSEGAIDKTGIPIKDEVSAAGVVGQFLGLSPSEVRLATEGKGAIYQKDRALLERRQSLMTRYALAAMAGDDEGKAEWLKDITVWNAKNPTRRITAMNLAQSIAARRRRMAQADGGVYLPKNRRDALEAGRFAKVE